MQQSDRIMKHILFAAVGMILAASTAHPQSLLLPALRLVNGSGSVTLQAASSGNITLTFPSSTGTNGQYLVTDGAGAMSWAAGPGAVSLDNLSDAKAGGVNFTNSIIIGHETTGTLSNAENNVVFGSGALSAVTSADDNVAIGLNALLTITTGSGNTAVGFDAGRTVASGSVYNTLVGYFTKRNGTAGTKSGDYNTAIGAYAMEEGSGSYNVFAGYLAGRNTTSSNNIAIGYEAMGSGTVSGGNNIAIGLQAMVNGGSGTDNVAIGSNALRGASAATTTGSYNVAVGAEVGYAFTSGSQNTVIGYQAGRSLTTGTGNVLIGYQAGYNLTTSSNQLYIDNSNTATPLIAGDFSTDDVTINGSLITTDGLTVAHSASETMTSDALNLDVSLTTAVEIVSNGNNAIDVVTLINGTNGSLAYIYYTVPATKTDDLEVDGVTYTAPTGGSIGLSFLRINGAWRSTGKVDYP
jgi:hypothetical protein